MSKVGIVVTIIIIIVVIILVAWLIGVYNAMVNKDVSVQNAWAQVENQYQRRFDLIPNLVETVKGLSAHETSLQTQVTALRTKSDSYTNEWNKAKTEGDVEGQIAAAEGIDSVLSGLTIAVEAYPVITANEAFVKLQDQIEGTENRISVERMRFNEDVADFNKYIKRIPQKWLAASFGFDVKDFFEIEEGVEEVPEVNFSSSAAN